MSLVLPTPPVGKAADLPAALANIIADAQSADAGTHVLPTADQARGHLELNVRCLYSGFFTGTYKGDDDGRWALIILPPGVLDGAAYSTEEDELIPLEFDPFLLSVQQNVGFVAGNTGSGSSFEGDFDSLNDISGTWTDGTFEGSRIAGADTAAYKFQTFLYRGTSANTQAVHALAFDISATDQVTGVVMPDITTGASPGTVTASLSGDTLTATMSAGPIITTTLNKQLPFTLQQGTWSSGPDGGISQTVGCRLN